MSKNNFRQFLADPDKVEPQFTEVPPPLPPAIAPTPSGYAPMSRIELEGRSYRGLVSGDVPWWVLITGSVMLIVPSFAMVLVEGSWLLLILSPLLALPIAIVWRGFRAKLLHQKERKQRLARRIRDMQD